VCAARLQPPRQHARSPLSAARRTARLPCCRSTRRSRTAARGWHWPCGSWPLARRTTAAVHCPISTLPAPHWLAAAESSTLASVSAPSIDKARPRRLHLPLWCSQPRLRVFRAREASCRGRRDANSAAPPAPRNAGASLQQHTRWGRGSGTRTKVTGSSNTPPHWCLMASSCTGSLDVHPTCAPT
jgi:hypothetical protein